MRGEDKDWTEGKPERLYIITGGRRASERASGLDLVTLIVSRSTPETGIQPEQAAILRMCHYPLSVAEISAYLNLPVSVVKLLLAELLAADHVEARAPIPTASLPDIELLEAVMHGLQRL